MNKNANKANSIGDSLLHESGFRHVTGEAKYVDDNQGPIGTLTSLIVPSPHAHAKIKSISTAKAKNVSGVHAVLTSQDIPGDPLVGPISHDEPLLAEEHVYFQGQSVAYIVGESEKACRRAAALVEVEYEPLSPSLSIQSAIKNADFHGEPHKIQRGTLNFEDCPHVVSGEVSSGAQDHFYLETQAALAVPKENGCFHIYSSSQHPTEIQKMTAHVLAIGAHQVVCEVPRMGGGFGGKESQATQIGVLAALGAYHTRRPVKLWLNRDQDMRQTGKRHPFWSSYKVGFQDNGKIDSLVVNIYCNGGWTTDLSLPILDLALFHIDNAYFIPNLRFVGRACKTNLPSNTAFRGFGGPQGMLVVETIMNEIAERLGLDSAIVRQRNFYQGPPFDVTPYGQIVKDCRLSRIYSELMQSSDYTVRRKNIEHFNQNNRFVRRGIGFQPVKFGISFTKSLLNQAGALVQIYTDGSVQLNHAGTEMGQGLYTKMIAVCAHELGVPLDAVRNMHTSTDKVPNTSPTAASSGSDLNGQAVYEACSILKKRLLPVAAKMLGCDDTAATIKFKDGLVYLASTPEKNISFRELCTQAWIERVSLSATGFYATPGIVYDQSKGQGTPFYYYAYGGAVVEVEVNLLTGEHRLLRVDILHDVGTSLVPSIDIGQVEGGFVQGLGWLTTEEVLFTPEGRLLTYSPSTYKIPSYGDIPRDFRVSLLDKAPQDGVIHGSKAVGEPPFMLAIGVVAALRHAILSCDSSKPVELSIPCTGEAILRAIAKQTGTFLDE